MLALLIGLVAGTIYFVGLYFSVQKINDVKYPSLFMALSFLIRMLILIGLFFYLSKVGGYKDILFALIGVMAARAIITFAVKNEKIGRAHV